MENKIEKIEINEHNLKILLQLIISILSPEQTEQVSEMLKKMVSVGLDTKPIVDQGVDRLKSYIN